jgi:general stress protein YciG
MQKDSTPAKAKRGFAAMSPERRIKIARLGGKAVPPKKRSFSTDRAFAAAAGGKGGANVNSPTALIRAAQARSRISPSALIPTSAAMPRNLRLRRGS